MSMMVSGLWGISKGTGYGRTQKEKATEVNGWVEKLMEKENTNGRMEMSTVDSGVNS